MKRAAALLLAAAATVIFPVPVPAQDRPVLRSNVLVIDQERLFSETVFGLNLSEQLESASVALAEENRAIEQMLTEEERALTEQRPTMSPELFREAADAFDARVSELRDQQDRKARVIAERSEAERRAFLDAALPVLGALMADYGAYAILDRRQVFLSDDRINVTDEAIALIDATLGDRVPPRDGAGAEDAPDRDAAPQETAPDGGGEDR